LSALAFEDAARLASRGLQAAPASSELSCELEIALAESLVRMDESSGGRQASLRAATTARHLGLPRLLAKAALAYGAQQESGIVDPMMVELLREALAALPNSDDPLRARAMVRLSTALSPPRDAAATAEIVRLAREGVAMGRRLGDDDTVLFVLRFAGSALGHNVSAEERFETTRETMALARRMERSVILLDRGPRWVGMLREHGLRADADAALDAYISLAREFPQPYHQFRPPLVLACHAMLDGDFERADRLAAEGLAVADAAAVFPGRLAWVMQRFAQAFLRDDLPSLAPDAECILKVCAQLEPTAPWANLVGAVVLAALGRDLEARARLAAFAIELTDLPNVLMAGHVALVLGDRPLGERMLPALIEGRDRVPFFWIPGGVAVFGPAARVAGEIAAMLGRTDEARTLLDEAIQASERLGSPPLVALARARREALGSNGSRAPKRSGAPPPDRHEIHIAQEGDMWSIRWASGAPILLRDTKGLHYLAELLRHPGRELHVTQLADLLEPAGDAGPVLDSRAKETYRRRIEDLRDTLEEARRFDDLARAERAEADIDALVEQLAGAVGLGGRGRKAGSHVERARVNVQRRLKDVLRRIEEQDPALGRYLAASIKTGAWCTFAPV
jgi:hypothetical protein